MLFEPAKRTSILWQPLLFAGWCAVTLIGLRLRPDPSGHGTHQELGLPPCPSALLFDRPCPGCGLTTSWTALLHGQWRSAFEAHPLGPPLYLLFTAAAFVAGIAFLTHRRLVLTSIPMSRALATTSLLFFAFGTYRMITTPHFRTDHESQILAQTFGR